MLLLAKFTKGLLLCVMDEDILVSVVIPVYNAAAHIQETISSIISQDHKNIEIIIVNDASADSSAADAKTLLENSGRAFRIIDHTKNLGVAAARNTGLDSAKGRYIWFCDSDDKAEKNFVSRLLAEAEDKNADIAFCGIKQYYESENRLIDDLIAFIPDSLSSEKYLTSWAEGKLYLWSIWNFLFRREHITKNGLRFHEGCRLGEDTEFLLKAVACASRVCCVNEMLYTYVHHSGQVTESRKNPEMLRHVMLSRLRAGRFLLRHTHSRKIRNYILNYYIPDIIVKQFTACAVIDDRKHFRKLKRTLKHKTMRKILQNTAKFSAAAPELFIKAIMLLYAPELYYLLRKGR